MSTTDSDNCAKALLKQEWFWKNSSKEEIHAALTDNPNGTFCVRDSSNGCDYTLSLKHDERIRLIKIIVSNGRCGFHEDALNYDSVTSLIEYYTRNSLKEYNVHLATQLLFPLKQPHDERSFWEIDGVHSVEHVLFQLRGIYAAHIRVMRFDEKICNELDSLRDELNRKRKARLAYKSAQNLFRKQFDILNKNMETVSDQVEKECCRVNVELQTKRIEIILHQLDQANDYVNILEKDIQERENIHISMLPKYADIHKELDKCKFRLCQQNVSAASLDRVYNEIAFLIDYEHVALSKVLIKFTMRWQPDRYLSMGCTKENAAKIIGKLMEFNTGNSDGIFLIRSSQSQPGQYALTVSYNEKIHNCLVEYRDVKHPESCGYAFSNTKLFFPSIVDFVRYYCNCSMKEHNAHLDTKLRMPAFKGTM